MASNGQKTRVLRPEEAKLWHKIAKSTRPISGKSLVEIEKQFEEEIKKFSDDKKIHVSVNYEKFVQKRSLIAKTELEIADAKNHKRVRRGKLEIDATLDLHGLNQEMAQTRLIEFVHLAIVRQYRTLLIITGKGNISKDEQHFDLLIAPRGILRKRLKEWLHTQSIKRHIAGISEAHLKHGGSGAFYVLLKAPNKN